MAKGNAHKTRNVRRICIAAGGRGAHERLLVCADLSRAAHQHSHYVQGRRRVATRAARRPRAARRMVERVSRPRAGSPRRQVAAANPDVAAAIARHDEATALSVAGPLGTVSDHRRRCVGDRQRQSDNRPLRGTDQPSGVRHEYRGRRHQLRPRPVGQGPQRSVGGSRGTAGERGRSRIRAPEPAGKSRRCVFQSARTRRATATAQRYDRHLSARPQAHVEPSRRRHRVGPRCVARANAARHRARVRRRYRRAPRALRACDREPDRHTRIEFLAGRRHRRSVSAVPSHRRARCAAATTSRHRRGRAARRRGECADRRREGGIFPGHLARARRRLSKRRRCRRG